MTDECKQKRPRREPWAQSAEKRSLEDNVARVLRGGHLPGAESTGVAAVAAAGLNAGPVLQLDLVAICNGDITNGELEVLCILALFQVIFFRIDRDMPLSGIRFGRTVGAGIFVGDGKFKALIGHIQRNLFGGTLDVDGAGERIINSIISRCLGGLDTQNRSV